MFFADERPEPSGGWRATNFDDLDWPKSRLPLGMDESADYDLATNLYGQMHGKFTSFYGRADLSAQAKHASSDEMLVLSIDYDDGFVLYINNVEVARANVGSNGLNTPFDAVADTSHRASNDEGDGIDHTETIELGKASLFLNAGINDLSLQVFNTSKTDSDLFINMSFQVGTDTIYSARTTWRYYIGSSEPVGNQEIAGVESDWIELYNPTDVAVNLEGWSLTDNDDIFNKWIFPAVSIEPKGYLLVLASGEDVTNPGERLQASFKLSASGEYLGLYDASGSMVSEFDPEYPSQPLGTSYGWADSESAYQVFADSTPGGPNSDMSLSGEVGDTSFSVDRGFFDEPFEVEITCETEGASIRYTLDGSTPSDSNGNLYTGPISVTTTTLLRAQAYKDDYLPSNVDTHTYIFIADVIKQDNAPEGFPSTLKWTGNPDLPADYEMDPEVTEDPLYKDLMRESLLSIPTISLVTNLEHLYDRDTGLYQNPQQHGEAWERPVSVELLYPSGKNGFQVNAGLRIQGGHTRSPSNSPKHSFRIAFRSEYGPGKLDFPLFPEPDSTEEFDTIVLRSHGNQAWTHHNGFRGNNRGRAQYVRDQFAKDLQGITGAPYVHNIYAFLYLDGVFWGLYNPTERATGGYGESYFGGDKDDYDALNSGELLDGTEDAWNVLMNLVNQNLSNMDRYHEISEILDLTAFTDYMLLNHWGGNEDWDHHNWYALRSRVEPGAKWFFYAWDNEFFFETPQADVTGKNTNNHPGEIFFSLLDNSEYRVLLADRIQQNFFNGGPLTTEATLPLWEERTAQVYRALVAESARWGDYRRDVHQRSGPYLLYTREDQWALERERVVNTIIPVRNEVTLGQYQGRGWMLSTPAPDFSKQSGALSGADPLVISTTSGGSTTIYYTLDGSDPRLEGGDVSPTAIVYASPITVSERTTVKARINNLANWGPVQVGDFHPEGDPADLQISEVLYAPLVSGEVEGKELEFVEIRNSGPANISLDGMEISGGIDFVFPAGLSVAPGGHIVVVSNVAAFSAQNPEVTIAGEYTGSLSNDGEKITLKHTDLGKIQQLVYSNWHPWPQEAATQGYSLVPVSLDYRGLPAQSIAWKAGTVPGGTPGMGDFEDTNWIEHPTFGWVYSETGTVNPGEWVYSLDMGYLYIESEENDGFWVYSPAPEDASELEDSAEAAWIDHPTYGWVYSETGTAVPGDWLYRLEAEYLYIGSEDAGELWTWFVK